MSISELLISRGFKLYERCNCGGNATEKYNSTLHKGFDIHVLPNRNQAIIKYHLIIKYNGAASELEPLINDIIVNAQAGK